MPASMFPADLFSASSAKPLFRSGSGAGFGLLCLWVVTAGPWLPLADPVLPVAAQSLRPQPGDQIRDPEPNASAAHIYQVTHLVPVVNLRLLANGFPDFAVYPIDIPVSGPDLSSNFSNLQIARNQLCSEEYQCAKLPFGESQEPKSSKTNEMQRRSPVISSHLFPVTLLLRQTVVASVWSRSVPGSGDKDEQTEEKMSGPEPQARAAITSANFF